MPAPPPPPPSSPQPVVFTPLPQGRRLLAARPVGTCPGGAVSHGYVDCLSEHLPCVCLASLRCRPGGMRAPDVLYLGPGHQAPGGAAQGPVLENRVRGHQTRDQREEGG